MSWVQCTHGGNTADSLSLTASCSNGFADFTWGWFNDHIFPTEIAIRPADASSYTQISLTSVKGIADFQFHRDQGLIDVADELNHGAD